mmetsp:Transcript_20036/g.29710  ORF Transcript_20036/g.29710 Transcript_20036/m.29710 type:complete len:381 (-) Transcript_20036:248-1390(-)
MHSLWNIFFLCILSVLPYKCHAFTSPVITVVNRPSSIETYLFTPLVESSSNIASITTFPSMINNYLHGQYAFMLPTATVVATSCQLAGIGGAALFSPIFLLVFPYLGPQYPLESVGAALASALLTECFGFASGLSGYARRGLVDWEVAGRFLTVSIPTALLGALSAKYVASNPVLLQSLYATLMLGLSCYLLLAPRPEEVAKLAAEEECDVDGFFADGRAVRYKIAADGTEFSYLSPPRGGSKSSIMATSAGGSLTGILGVGIGEVVLPQLVRGCCMPLPVAAGTSVAIVVTTALTAAVVQFLTLAASVEGSLVEGLVAVVPLNLVQYTVPGVLLGGQLAPFLASRETFSDEDIERFAATLFAIVGTAFAIKASTGIIGS